MLLASLEPCSWKKFRPTHLLSLVSGTVRLVFGLYALPSAYPYAQDLTRLAGKSWSEIPGFVDLNVLSSNRIREDLNWKLRRQNYAVVLRARQTNATDADVTAITAYPNLTRKCRSSKLLCQWEVTFSSYCLHVSHSIRISYPTTRTYWACPLGVVCRNLWLPCFYQRLTPRLSASGVSTTHCIRNYELEYLPGFPQHAVSPLISPMPTPPLLALKFSLTTPDCTVGSDQQAWSYKATRIYQWPVMIM